MLNKSNSLIKGLSSVDLALLIISAIAVTSILGTIIPQGEAIQFYARGYGSKTAVILELLGITNMYSSNWFRGLLILLCLNLIVCTWVRFPSVLAVINKDNLKISTKSITNNKEAIVLTSDLPCNSLQFSELSNILKPFSFKKNKIKDNEWVFLHQKGAWSRTGAYVVHLSILFIVFGTLIGKFWGYDAFVMVKEGTSISSVRVSGNSGKVIPLGFDVFCQNFKTDYYPGGAPKAYKSDLSILESKKSVIDKIITVNNPLKYNGVTFFQASYQPIENEYKLVVAQTDRFDKTKSFSRTIFLNPFSEHKSEEFEASFKILATSSDGHGHGPYKLQITSGDSTIVRVMEDHEPLVIESDLAVYTINLAQRFATGLKVVKDPGVWVVYFGCGLMLLGLYVSFFMSHIRIWVVYQSGKRGSQITVLGKTNKNSLKMEQLQEKIVRTLLHEKKLSLRRV